MRRLLLPHCHLFKEIFLHRGSCHLRLARCCCCCCCCCLRCCCCCCLLLPAAACSAASLLCLASSCCACADCLCACTAAASACLPACLLCCLGCCKQLQDLLVIKWTVLEQLLLRQRPARQQPWMLLEPLLLRAAQLFSEVCSFPGSYLEISVTLFVPRVCLNLPGASLLMPHPLSRCGCFYGFPVLLTPLSRH